LPEDGNDEQKALALAAYRDRFFLRTLGHEVGHVLNLCHQPKASAALMSEGKPDRHDLTHLELTDAEKEHLTRHESDCVRPGSTVAYGRCSSPVDHQICSADAEAARSAARDQSPLEARTLRLQLIVHPGTVYPQTEVPTLVIGEPLCLTAKLNNGSDGVVHVDGPADGAHGGLLLFARVAERLELLASPALACVRRDESLIAVEPEGRFEAHETVIYRRGRLVFPEPGAYRLFASLRLVTGWVASPEVTVHVAPPLKERHERYCRLAALRRTCLDLELGGSALLAERDHTARELLRAAPDFPLCDHIRLAAGRWARRAGGIPYPSWKASLDRVERNSLQPAFLRAQARSLRQDETEA